MLLRSNPQHDSGNLKEGPFTNTKQTQSNMKTHLCKVEEPVGAATKLLVDRPRL